MKYLNVAEKNDAAKSIAGFLSNGRAQRSEGYSVFNKIYSFEANVLGTKANMVMTSVSGHLLGHEFVDAYSKWHACDPISLFEAPVYKGCAEKFMPIRRTIEREIKSCQGLIIWTDCDREGENIGFEIIDVCKAIKPNIKIYRAKFSEITATGIKRALNNLGEPDERQSQAVDVRAELDLRIGAAFTRFQTLRYQQMFPTHVEHGDLVSYGSCQIPTLGFVVRRFNEVEKFIPQPFWKLKLTHTLNDLTVEYNWARHRLFDQNCCEAFLMLCQVDPTAHVISVTEKPKNKWRPQAMDTIELEKLGSRKLRITAKETMTIAEKLYSKGIISYPRTETNQFSSDINLRSLVENHVPHPAWGNFASRVLEWGPNPRNGNKSDQAHPPIHPTKFTTELTGNDQRVYELIVRHFLACLSKDATGSETTVTVHIADEEFTATGLCIYERNYLDVYIYDRWNAKEIHNYETGNTFEPTELAMIEGSTTAPNLLTEADLISLMDKHGIGTDATHAEHINTIKTRGYIGEVNGGYLVPGTIGMGLVEGYESINLPLAHPELRAELERDLKLVCAGQRDPKQVLQEQVRKYKEVYIQITQQIQAMDATLGNRLNTAPQAIADPLPTMPIEEVFKCPKCDRFKMVLRTKRDSSGFYLNCLGNPECKNIIWLPDLVKEIKVHDSVCTTCRVGNKKVLIKFKQMSVLGLLNGSNIVDNSYLSCIVCDSQLRSILDINESSVRKMNATSGRNTSTMNSNPTSWNTSVNRPNTTSSTRTQSSTTTSSGSSVNSARPSGFGSSGATSTSGYSRPSSSSGYPSSSSGYPSNSSGYNSNITNNRNNGQNILMPSRNNNSSNTNARPSNNGDTLLCPNCRTPCTKFTVKKPGPNIGRPFFTCPKKPQCNFFQWADIAPDAIMGANRAGPSSSASTNTSRDTWNARPGTSNSTNDANQTRAKRKCGICKQEGHTRQKCPRRLDSL